MNKGIFDIQIIDVYLTRAHSSTWVFDTGSVANICNSKQGLRIKRRLSKYYNRLNRVGVNLPDDSVIDRILQSLPPSYKSFAMNYNMQGMNKTISELFAMLKAAEVEIKKGASSVDGH